VTPASSRSARPRALVSRPVYPGTLADLEAVADVDHCDDDEGFGAAELKRRLAGCEALVCQLVDPIDAAVLDAAPDLRVVANVAVGYDNIDVAAATGRGIVVTNTPGVLTDATADLTMALLLAAGRRIVEADRFVRAGRWQRWEIDLLCGADLNGATLGIVGMGRIGRAVARRAAAFGLRIVFWNRSDIDVGDLPFDARQAELDALLADSDFVSLHVALTAETRHLLGADAFARMKDTAILVNTARGDVVDQEALVAALREGAIGSAALDVFADEPRVPQDLLDMERVVLAPHIGSASIGTRTRMCRMAGADAAAVLRGERPRHPVNPEVLDG